MDSELHPAPHPVFRIGIIGAGKMTLKKHLPALARLRAEGVCVIKEICDIDGSASEHAARLFDIPTHSHDARQLISREDVDAVFIFAPADVHYREGCAVLRAKKHLFLEKPPAQNTSQMKELILLACENNRITASGFNRRFQTNVRTVVSHLRPHAITSAEAVFHKPNADEPVPFSMHSWLGVSGIHAIDTLCFILGERPTALYSVHNGVSDGSPHNFSALILWGDRHATLSANNSAGSRTERYMFHGHGVSYVIEGNTLKVQRSSVSNEQSSIDDDVSEGIYAEFRAFFSAIHEGVEPEHSLSRTISTLYVVELMEKSHQGTIDWSVLDAIDSKESLSEEKVPALTSIRTLPRDARSVLILNPQALHNELPEIGRHARIVYQQELENLSDSERGKIAGALTGGPHALPITHKHLEMLPNLSFLGVLGASVKKWGGEEAAARGVSVFNTADVYAQPVAEFIVMQALVGLRKASMSHDVMRRGGWGILEHAPQNPLRALLKALVNLPLMSKIKPYLRPLWPSPQAEIQKRKKIADVLFGKTIGMIGYGEVTKRAIPLFQAFHCKILVHSDHLNPAQAAELGVASATLDEVLRADVVSLQRGLSSRTEHSFGSREIYSMRSGTVFINSGRAGLVDTAALLARLRQGDIFTCLDVYDEEPLPSKDELRRLPNVFLTSHLAASLEHTKGLVEEAAAALRHKAVGRIQNESPAALSREQLSNMT